ncbi:MAG: rod shape-determining protein MreC [Saprospiraceae bacterium]|nr:rod shape-determining protein MreC [Saprospiraceae bacterium]MCB0623604.1 rod shape-determining protein MreC [Saprospiraceae bacterium]MCB0682103.1 rod shape-determining protein MreC [Saprospiraceae bacterium]
MRNLILLFVRYGGFLLFVFFELISFSLIVRFNEAQGAIYLNSLSNATNFVDESVAGAIDYFSLRRVNDSLLAENARLRTQLLNRPPQNPPSIDTLNNAEDSLVYELFPARVIYNSITRRNNYLTINKGSADGVEERMGVITPQGPVGVVRSVNRHHALIMPLLHQQSRLSASIRREDEKYFGSLVWNGRDPKRADLVYVPLHAEPVVGDTIETSGFSTIFPAGLPIGVIDQVSLESGSNFYDIEVELFADFGRLEFVYIVRNNNKQAQRELLQQQENE